LNCSCQILFGENRIATKPNIKKFVLELRGDEKY